MSPLAVRLSHRIRAAAGAGVLAGIVVLPAGAQETAIPPPPTPGEELALNSDLRIRVRNGRDIELLVLPMPGESYARFAERVAGSAALGPALSDWNRDARLAPDRFAAAPLSLLSEDYRILVLLSLFPKDRRDGADWIHVAREGRLATYDEGLWQVAQWFTGDGSRFEEIRTANKLPTPELGRGQEIRIPARLLHPALRPRPRSDDGSLEFGEDRKGAYAGYRLKAGEALYSAVVVRFTGRTRAEDVKTLAADLARRSDIRDLTDIPVHYLVKIPFEFLEPEFLPRDHPRRREAEAAKEEMAKALDREPVGRTRGGLQGVLLILDPGHGGRDLGTMKNGIWEHDYVYDVACRLKAKLERHSQARVVMTLEDAQTGTAPIDADRLKANRQGTVKTHPPFLARANGDATIAVNLRWYLANSVYRSETKKGTRSDRIVFLSLHADARDPSLRGVMAYVPGAKHRSKTYGHNSKTYRRFKEVREKPHVRFSHKSRVRSEAVSRKLANQIVAEFRRQGLPIQPYKPVRNRIIRGRRAWLPAVLRGNEVPSKVLVEMVNLSNRKDAELLKTAAGRDRLAEGLFASLFRYFGEKPPQTSAARRAGS